MVQVRLVMELLAGAAVLRGGRPLGSAERFAPARSTASSQLWLKTCHWHVFKRVAPLVAYGDREPRPAA